MATSRECERRGSPAGRRALRLVRDAAVVAKRHSGQTGAPAAPTNGEWRGGGCAHTPQQTGNGMVTLPFYTPAGQRRIERRSQMFWIYWDTAWSVIISGIMFATIVAHPDAEFAEVKAARLEK
jgi:hypothetical protein